MKSARDSIGFLAWKVLRLFTNKKAACFAANGVEITVEQWNVLIAIYNRDGMTQGELCSTMSQEKTGVSRLVSALEKRGYVRREASKEDRRVKYIYCTQRGRDVMESSYGMACELIEGMLEHIDPDELAVCKKVLWEIIEPHLSERDLKEYLKNETNQG